MRINKKKSVTLVNRTNYFIPGKDKVKVRFSSPDTYQSRNIKIEGYETRLYWQYRYCQDHSGQTFFYTLTYNDKAMPTYLGQNCFDYEDLRYLFTGGFRKMLLRKYGTTFKYFVGAELGDGKGERGIHNNPHYHILFFLEPAKDDRYPYQVIDPIEFRHLVRLYWQGFDESVDGYRDYNEARYGIAKEGENDGLVKDFRACMYCAKYVCKDVKLKQFEDEIEHKLRFKYETDLSLSQEFAKKFFDEFINPQYNIPLNARKTKWTFPGPIDLMEYLLPDYFSFYKDCGIDYQSQSLNYLDFARNLMAKRPEVSSVWDSMYNSFLDEKVHQSLNEYRNRYCNKCRISQGVGDYALDHIDDKMNPIIQVPSKKGFKNRPISMYYYRKLYTDVVKDAKGQNMRILNQLGIDYKVSKLSSQLKSKEDLVKSYIGLMTDRTIGRTLFETMRSSDINTEVYFHYDEWISDFHKYYEEDIQNIIRRYAEYKLVYEDRFFKVKSLGDNSSVVFPDIDLFNDYRTFIRPSYCDGYYDPFGVISFIESNSEDYMAYYTHPYFLRYTRIFAVFDMFSDYFFIKGDDKNQKQAEEIAGIKRFHDGFRLREFYSGFRNS